MEADTDADIILSPKHEILLSWVKSLLKNEENYKRWRSLYRPPIVTNEFTESIFSQFDRIFEAQDAYERHEFEDPQDEMDSRDYRKRIGDFTFWETRGMEAMKSSIDDFLIIDLPKLQYDETRGFAQETDLPEPYYYMLDICNVLDVWNRRIDGKDTITGKPFYYFRTEYIIFWDSPDKVCVFDDTFYRSYQYIPGNEPKLVDEFPHNLGYTPACSYWTTALNDTANVLKAGPITKSLSDLDWLAFFTYSAQYLKLYAPFPIYAVYKGTCNYTTADGRYKCVDGYLAPAEMAKGKNKSFSGGGENSTRCPKCENKIRTGAGNVLELRAPQEQGDPDLLANPIKVIPAEKVSLDAVNNEIATVRARIYDNCIGKGSESIANQAQNEMQIEGGFESKVSVLMKVKRNVEIAHNFVLDTVFRLRYGDGYKGGIVSYGTKFFLKDSEEEAEDYKKAKDNGLPESDLMMRLDRMDEAEFRNDPDALDRSRVMRNLDPFPLYNIKDTIDYSKSVSVDPVDLILKMNFPRFIKQFEREQGGLLMFGRKLDFDKKIDAISNIIRGYATDYLAAMKAESKPPADHGTNPPPGPGGPKPGEDPTDKPPGEDPPGDLSGS